MPPTDTAPAAPGLHEPAITGLRGSSRGSECRAAGDRLADLGRRHSYLDIPAFLRRQAD